VSAPSQRRLSAVGLVLGLGALLAAPACSQGTACVDLAASDLSYDGRTYVRQGDLTRFPAASPTLGTGTRPVSYCGDDPRTMRVEVSEVSGVPAQEAVIAEGELFVFGPVSARLRALTEPVACVTRGVFSLAGAWNDTEALREQEDVPPYDILLLTGADSGEPAYDDAHLAVRVTRSTALPSRDELIRLRATGARTELRIRCRGTQFRAEEIR